MNSFPMGMPPTSDDDFPEGSVRRSSSVVPLPRQTKAADRGDRSAKSLDALKTEHAAAKNDLGWPEPLDLEALSKKEPEPPKFIMADWLPCGYMTLFAGHGGMGKSGIALHLAICMAFGIPFFGIPVERRRVIYLSCEDREDLLHWRLTRMCAYLGLDMADAKGWLKIHDLVGRDSVLWGARDRDGKSLTAAYGFLIERVDEYQSEVIVVDGITDTYDGMGGSSSEIKRFVNSLVAMIPADRGAVLLIGHIDKASARNSATGIKNTEGYSGAAGWHNSARARWYLSPETEKDDEDGTTSKTGPLCLELQKSNLGRLDQKMAFTWDDDAHIFIGQRTIATPFDLRHQDREEQAGILRALKSCLDAGVYVPAATTGPRTAFMVLSNRPEFPEALKGAGRTKSRRFWRQVEVLRQLRHLQEGSIGRKGGHKTTTLELTSVGIAACA